MDFITARDFNSKDKFIKVLDFIKSEAGMVGVSGRREEGGGDEETK